MIFRKRRSRPPLLREFRRRSTEATLRSVRAWTVQVPTLEKDQVVSNGPLLNCSCPFQVCHGKIFNDLLLMTFWVSLMYVESELWSDDGFCGLDGMVV